MRSISTDLKSGIAIALLIALGLPASAGAQGFRYWNPLDTSHVVPATLSATGLYTDILSRKKQLLPNAYYFDVNSPLWSDDAKKKRWVMLKPGKSIKFVEREDYWEYPDSTVFIKEFAIDTIPGDSTSRVAWETRILLLKKEILDSAKNLYTDTWFGYSYKWNADQRDAVLIPIRGKHDSIRIYPQGRTMPSVMKKWTFPSRDDCMRCHRTGNSFVSNDEILHGRTVLGFFTAQLNRPHADSAHLNQIEFFFRRNVLTGIKPANYATAPKWHGIKDAAGTDDQKARAYIAANCSGCHGARGVPTGATNGVQLDYDYHTLEPRFEFRHQRTGHYGREEIEPFFYAKTGDGNNPNLLDTLRILPALVVPGYPEKSVILFRQMQRNSAAPLGIDEDFYPADYQMPPLAVFQRDTAALNLMTRWIRNMPRIPAPEPPSSIFSRAGRMHLKGPAIQGRVMVIPAELAEGGRARVTMTAITGRTVALTRTAGTAFAIPANLPRGVYIIKVGSRSFTRNLF